VALEFGVLKYAMLRLTQQYHREYLKGFRTELMLEARSNVLLIFRKGTENSHFRTLCTWFCAGEINCL